MTAFQPIEQLDRELYRSALKEYGFTYRSCEYSYANIFAWRNTYRTEFAKTENGYIFCLHHDGADYYFCPVAPKEWIKPAFEEIFETEREKGAGTVNFVCLPEVCARLLEETGRRADVEAVRDSFDYIYLRDSLASFSGKALHAKKNHRNKFFALYGDSYEYRAMTSEDAALCIEFNKEWYGINAGYSDEKLEEERKATEELLKNFDRLGLMGAMILVDGKVVAYTLASDSYDGSDTLITHTEKGLYDIQGIYPAICSEFLINQGEGYEYVNREDDAGDEGLRRSKTSYNPVCFEEKYNAAVYL